MSSAPVGRPLAGRVRDWGWRLPFVFGALLAVVARYPRARLVESTAFTAQRTRPERPTLRASIAAQSDR